MKNSTTKTIFYLSVITVLFSIGLFLFFFRVIQNKNQHASKVLATLQEKITEKANMVVFEEKIAEVESTHKAIDGYFLSADKIDIFVSYLEKFGEETNTELVVKNVEISKTEKNKILVSLSIRGKFSSIMQVLALLENSPYQIDVTQTYLNKVNQLTPQKDSKNTKTENTTDSIWQTIMSFKVLSS
jgi:hypothetical protein